MAKRTYPKKLPRDWPRGDYKAQCAYCGVVWMRSSLRLDGAGNLYCPDEGDGLDAVTLSRMNADAAKRDSRYRMNANRYSGGGAGNPGDQTPIVRTTYEDIKK